jgi:hypothetical protein
MLRALRIPELAQRDRFLRAAIVSGRVYTVMDGADLATVDSPREPLRGTALLWSRLAEARRWADVLAREPSVATLSLGQLVARTLPELGMHGLLAGTDWNAEPCEPELTPSDLASRLSIEAQEAFLAQASASGSLWILEHAEGPALIGSARAHLGEHSTAAQTVLPCWTRRADAELHAADRWAGAKALSIPLDSFRKLTLPWLAEQGWLVAAATPEEAHGLELTPHALSARLATAQAAE